jgi:hypothetical protein
VVAEMLAAARPACAALHNARRYVELAHHAIVRASEDADNSNDKL